eukprot:6839355-Prymnesium_polylepis.2
MRSAQGAHAHAAVWPRSRALAASRSELLIVTYDFVSQKVQREREKYVLKLIFTPLCVEAL